MDRRAFLQASAAAALMSRRAGVHADDLAAYKRPAEDVTTGMDLSGKTVLVTGCNSGLGSETRRVLGIIWGLRQLRLTGRTYARQEIYGLDFIRTMSCIGEWRRMTLLKARIQQYPPSEQRSVTVPEPFSACAELRLRS